MSMDAGTRPSPGVIPSSSKMTLEITKYKASPTPIMKSPHNLNKEQQKNKRTTEEKEKKTGSGRNQMDM